MAKPTIIWIQLNPYASSMNFQQVIDDRRSAGTPTASSVHRGGPTAESRNLRWRRFARCLVWSSGWKPLVTSLFFLEHRSTPFRFSSLNCLDRQLATWQVGKGSDPLDLFGIQRLIDVHQDCNAFGGSLKNESNTRLKCFNVPNLPGVLPDPWKESFMRLLTASPSWSEALPKRRETQGPAGYFPAVDQHHWGNDCKQDSPAILTQADVITHKLIQRATKVCTKKTLPQLGWFWKTPLLLQPGMSPRSFTRWQPWQVSKYGPCGKRRPLGTPWQVLKGWKQVEAGGRIQPKYLWWNWFTFCGSLQTGEKHVASRYIQSSAIKWLYSDFVWVCPVSRSGSQDCFPRWGQVKGMTEQISEVCQRFGGQNRGTKLQFMT